MLTNEYLGMSQVDGSDMHAPGAASMIENSSQKNEPSLLLLNNRRASLDESVNKFYSKNINDPNIASFLDD